MQKSPKFSCINVLSPGTNHHLRETRIRSMRKALEQPSPALRFERASISSSPSGLGRRNLAMFDMERRADLDGSLQLRLQNQMIRLSLDKILDFIILPLLRLGSQGVKGTLESMACRPGRHAILLLICSLSLLVTGGTVAEPQNYKDDFQKCTCADPSVWEIHDRVLKAAAVTILAALLTIGIVVAGRTINRPRQLLPEIRAEIPVIPLVVGQALPIIPEVQGDDLDDVLARAPIPTRLNSPLSWL